MLHRVYHLNRGFETLERKLACGTDKRLSGWAWGWTAAWRILGFRQQRGALSAVKIPIRTPSSWSADVREAAEQAQQ